MTSRGSDDPHPPAAGAPARLGPLRQIQVRFDTENDRLLLRTNTQEGAELRCWLTRRLVKRLWPVLIQALEGTPEVAAQTTQEAKQAVVEFRREESLARSDFSTPFDATASETPLGEEPILVSRVGLDRTGNGHLLRLLPLEGQGLSLAIDDRVLHSFCELLRRAVAVSDWDLDLGTQPTTPSVSPDRRH